MQKSIPASSVVQILPGVIGTGGNPLSLNGVVVDESLLIPSGSVLGFGSQKAVANYFGPNSTEAGIATKYFAGFTNAAQLPGTLYFAPYASAARAAELFGGSLASMTLTQLQALTGVLTITIAGSALTSSSINLSAATSFSNAATIMTAAFTAPGFAITYSAQQSRFVVTSTATGAAETIVYATGSLAAGVAFTSATGAILSQGIDADTPSAAMNRLVGITQNWADFMTLLEYDTATKLLFAAWTNTQNKRYAFVAHDSDVNTIVANTNTTFGAICVAAGYDAVFPISGDPAVAAAAGTTVDAQARDIAAFVLGIGASIDFSRANGRQNYCFRAQPGLAFNVNDQQIGENLVTNGYNFYGAFATANQGFVYLTPGTVTGAFKWMDAYINQIWMNNAFQLSWMTFLTSVGTFPYNTAGYKQSQQALSTDIENAVNFGAIQPGITLTSTQKAIINAAAGLDISGPLFAQGWYLQVKDPGATVRGQRGSPICNFWYTDGGSVQKLTLSSLDVQ